MQPVTATLTILWMIATFAIMYGALLIVLAFKVKKFGA
jgi:uncharacterized membrane protein HdeD (DUF308 family)